MKLALRIARARLWVLPLSGLLLASAPAALLSGAGATGTAPPPSLVDAYHEVCELIDERANPPPESETTWSVHLGSLQCRHAPDFRIWLEHKGSAEGMYRIRVDTHDEGNDDPTVRPDPPTEERKFDNNRQLVLVVPSHLWGTLQWQSLCQDFFHSLELADAEIAKLFASLNEILAPVLGTKVNPPDLTPAIETGPPTLPNPQVQGPSAPTAPSTLPQALDVNLAANDGSSHAIASSEGSLTGYDFLAATEQGETPTKGTTRAVDKIQVTNRVGSTTLETKASSGPARVFFFETVEDAIGLSRDEEDFTGETGAEPAGSTQVLDPAILEAARESPPVVLAAPAREKVTPDADAGHEPPILQVQANARVPGAVPPGAREWGNLALATAAAVLGTLLAAALYSRLSRRDVLSNEARASIVEILRAEPGLLATEVANRLGIHRTTAEYHLRLLERVGAVVSREPDGNQRYYLPGSPDALAPPTPPALRAPTARAVLEAVRARPGATVSEAAAAAGVDLPQASRHVKRLRDARFIEVREDGRFRRLFPSG